MKLFKRKKNKKQKQVEEHPDKIIMGRRMVWHDLSKRYVYRPEKNQSHIMDLRLSEDIWKKNQENILENRRKGLVG